MNAPSVIHEEVILTPEGGEIWEQVMDPATQVMGGLPDRSRRVQEVARRGSTIQERFEEFDAAHPDVYLLFRRFALELLASGRRRIGAKLLVERIRWHYVTSSGGGEEFKIDNRYTSRYVRKLIAERPEFADVFEVRRLQTP